MKGVDMDTADDTGMSYGCQYGCGNPMHIILLQIQDGSFLALCIPCFVKTAIEIVDAMTGDVTPEVQSQVDELRAMQSEQAPGPRARRGRHNAPAGTTDPDLIEAYDTSITVDELSDEFR